MVGNNMRDRKSPQLVFPLTETTKTSKMDKGERRSGQNINNRENRNKET